MQLRDNDKGLELSITGSIWNNLHTDIVMGGQCLDEMAKYIHTPTFKALRAMWKRWHLNGMRSACEHQRELGQTYKSHPDAKCDTCGYALGSAWLHEALPAEVLKEIETMTGKQIRALATA